MTGLFYLIPIILKFNHQDVGLGYSMAIFLRAMPSSVKNLM